MATTSTIQSNSFLNSQVTQRVIEQTDQHQVTVAKLASGAFFEVPKVENCEASITIVHGNGKIMIGDEEKEVSPYTTMRCMADKTHKVFNNQKETLELLYVRGRKGEYSEENQKESYVRNIKDCDEFKAGEGESIYELFGTFNGNAENHSIAVVKIKEGCSSTIHRHPKIEEGYYMTKGEARLYVDGKTKELKPGEFAKIPVGKMHQIFNDKQPTHEFVAICSKPWTPDCAVYE